MHNYAFTYVIWSSVTVMLAKIYLKILNPSDDKGDENTENSSSISKLVPVLLEDPHIMTS